MKFFSATKNLDRNFTKSYKYIPVVNENTTWSICDTTIFILLWANTNKSARSTADQNLALLHKLQL